MKHVSRRKFLKLGLLAAAMPLPASASAWLAAPERRLSFHNLHTGENLDLPYWVQGDYVPDALAEINHVLRDYRRTRHQECRYDRDLLHAVLQVMRRAAFPVLAFPTPTPAPAPRR